MSRPRPYANDPCLNCDGTGSKPQGWAGGVMPDGTTCFDCKGTGKDQSTYGVGNDSCPHCGADWKQDHDADCATRVG